MLSAQTPGFASPITPWLPQGAAPALPGSAPLTQGLGQLLPGATSLPSCRAMPPSWLCPPCLYFPVPGVSCTISAPSTPTLAPAVTPALQATCSHTEQNPSHSHGAAPPASIPHIAPGRTSWGTSQGGGRRRSTRWECWSHPGVPEHPPASSQGRRGVSEGTAPTGAQVGTSLVQTARETLPVPALIKPQDGSSSSGSSGGHRDALGPAAEGPARRGLPRGEAKRRRRGPKGCWQPVRSKQSSSAGLKRVRSLSVPGWHSRAPKASIPPIQRELGAGVQLAPTSERPPSLSGSGAAPGDPTAASSAPSPANTTPGTQCSPSRAPLLAGAPQPWQRAGKLFSCLRKLGGAFWGGFVPAPGWPCQSHSAII